MRRLIVFPILLFLGCEKDQSKTIEDLQRQVKELSSRAVGAASDAAGKVDLNASLDEVEKLFKFEYGVFSFPHDTDPEGLAKRLNELGQDRWDCFFIDRNTADPQAAISVVCKRKPKSVLRYVPQSIAGGLLNLLH